MKEWFFTFGAGERCACLRTVSLAYTRIQGEDFHDARARMFRRWGDQWCGQYDSAEAAGVEHFQLRYVPTSDDLLRCPCGKDEASVVRLRSLVCVECEGEAAVLLEPRAEEPAKLPGRVLCLGCIERMRYRP